MTRRSSGARASSPRRSLKEARRIVVKIGSRALAAKQAASPQSPEGEPSIFDQLAGAIAGITGLHAVSKRGKKRGKKQRSVVLVSSGAIAFGMKQLSFGRRPKEMRRLQAAAAAGQSVLMNRYAQAFEAHQMKTAQVLLTHADLAHRDRANNAREALLTLLDLGVVPIINENDAVAVDEIRFGDNDALASMVAPLCEADLLILLSDVEGVLDEKGQRVSALERIEDASPWLKDGRSKLGTGGMKSKLEAAKRASLAGTDVVIASAHEPNIIERILAGEDVGTLLAARGSKLRSRKHWIAYTLRPRGAAIVDEGAAAAIASQGKSVLSVGVLGVRGNFGSGDCVSVVDGRTGRTIARGLSRLSAADAARQAGQRSESGKPVVLVHRDDLVVLSED